MTLSSRFQLVKRHRSAVILASCVAIAVTGGLAFIWHDPVANQARAQSYGVNLASTLAAQGMEAMLKPDHLHLSVLANRMAALPGVDEARYLDANHTLLAESGTSGTQLTFVEPIILGGIITGHAHIGLNENAFAPQVSNAQIFATVLLILLMPLLALMAGEWPARRRKPVPIVEFPEDEKIYEGPKWVVLINLYNQLAFPNEERRHIFAPTLESALEVAHLYQGTARLASGTGVVVEFNDIDDAAFKATCASFLLLRVLAATNAGRTQSGQAEYRVALHYASDGKVSSETLADAALLAALAKEGTLLATLEFFDTLGKVERVAWEPFRHPMLSDVEIVEDEARMLTHLSDSHNALLIQQANIVVDHSTSNASTL